MEIKKARLAELQAEINRMAAEIAHNMIGTTQRVLVEKISRKSGEQVSGRTENNRPVNFAGGPELIGKFVDVEITEALYNSLRARYVRTVTEDVGTEQRVA